MAIKTIVIKGSGIRKEAQAGGAVTPGHLVMRASDGDIEVHGTAGGAAQAAFAVENELAGKDIDVAYAADDQIFWEVLPPGAEVNALVAAGAAAIAIGDYLVSAGDGTLEKYTAQAVNEGGAATYTVHSNPIVARAIEAVDNSGGGAAVRIKVEVV